MAGFSYWNKYMIIYIMIMFLDFPPQPSLPKNTNNFRKYIYAICVFLLLIILLMWYKSYSLYESSTSAKLNLASRNTQNYDSNLSQTIFSLQNIYNGYKNEWSWSSNFIAKYDADASIIIDNLPKIKSYIPANYQNIYQKLLELTNYKLDIYNMIGQWSPKTYLIALMNTNEIRPNGGFWWSYILAKFDKGKLLEAKIHDAYYPNYIYSWLSMQWPERLSQIYTGSQIWFISSNKIGFTDRDGYHISTLYNKAFPDTHIDGVIFIKSSAVRDILRWWDGKFREWQFANANINQISGSDTKNKKQIFVDELQKYLDTNKEYLLSQFAKHSEQLISNNNVQAYLPYASQPFRDRLINNNLTTSYNPEYVYLYDSNMSYSKIDGFINKQVYYNNIPFSYSYKIPALTWIMNIDINYTLNIPNIYINYIYNLTSKYKIKLTSRENHILALDYIRNNRWVVRLPKWSILKSITGDIYDHKNFKTPFADWIVYYIRNDTNHTNKKVNLKIEIK